MEEHMISQYHMWPDPIPLPSGHLHSLVLHQQNYVLGTGHRIPIGKVEAYPRAREQKKP